MSHISICTLFFALGSVTVDSAPTNSSTVTCSKTSDDCNNQIIGSVCCHSKGECICKVGFRNINNVCVQIECHSNADCDPHRYQQDSNIDHSAMIDSVCDIVHNRCVCLQGYYESSEGMCQYGNPFDWSIIVINAAIYCAISTVVVAIFCFCLWCVFDEPLNKCKKCTKNCLDKGNGPVYKSEDGPTLKGMMSAKSAYVAPRVSKGSARRAKKRMASSGGGSKRGRSLTQSLKKNKPKQNSAKM